MAYINEAEQRRRIIEVVSRETGVNCPELVVEDIEEVLGPATVLYRCRKGGDIEQLRLKEEDAKYIGLDRNAYGPPETGG